MSQDSRDRVMLSTDERLLLMGLEGEDREDLALRVGVLASAVWNTDYGLELADALAVSPAALRAFGAAEPTSEFEEDFAFFHREYVPTDKEFERAGKSLPAVSVKDRARSHAASIVFGALRQCARGEVRYSWVRTEDKFALSFFMVAMGLATEDLGTMGPDLVLRPPKLSGGVAVSEEDASIRDALRSIGETAAFAVGWHYVLDKQRYQEYVPLARQRMVTRPVDYWDVKLCP